jgi:hypothetical protein
MLDSATLSKIEITYPDPVSWEKSVADSWLSARG